MLAVAYPRVECFFISVEEPGVWPLTYQPIRASYDSDNPLVVGDVGMAGVAVDSVEGMKVTLITVGPFKFSNNIYTEK